MNAHSRTDMASSRTFSLENELLSTLMKLKLDCLFEDLAMWFSLRKTTTSRIFTAWLMLLYKKIRDSAQLPNWPRKEQVMMTMPQSFIDPYLSSRVIDCTEFAIEVSSDPDAQRVTWWTYKNRNTLEALVGIIPSGVIYFCRRCTVDLYQTEESHHRVAFYRNSKKETASWLTKASQSMTFWTRWVRS